MIDKSNKLLGWLLTLAGMDLSWLVIVCSKGGEGGECRKLSV